MSDGSTPAPWGIERVVQSSGLPRLFVHDAFAFNSIAEVYTNANDDGEADARLISCAPELYACLKNFVAHAEYGGELPPASVIEAAKAALAKVEGRES